MARSVEIVPALYQAFGHFNQRLFGGKLPLVVITLHRHRNANGYFMREAYQARGDVAVTGGEIAHEIALNPDAFKGRSDDAILSTLVHEMVHLQQQVQGKPGRTCYHNREWADWMKAVGLKPFNVQDPKKETGQACSHDIVPDGKFDMACRELMEAGFLVGWNGTPGEPKAKQVSKVPYECADCGVKVWGKPALRIVCGECGQFFNCIVPNNDEEGDGGEDGA